MSDIDPLTDLGRRLAALFPVAAQHRGWTVRNLSHNFEQTPWGVEETWSCEIVGPRDVWSSRQRFAGTAPDTFLSGVAAGILGSAEAVSADALVDQVCTLVDTLGIRDLREPVR